MPEKIMGFTDSTHTVYWPVKTNKKDDLESLSKYVSTKFIPNNVCVSWHFPNVIYNI